MPAIDLSAFATDADILLQYPALADTVWRVVVTDNADATYTITVRGVAYSFIAVAQTIVEIRDGLEAALQAGAGLFMAVADAATNNVIDIVSDVPGLSLAVETSPSTLFPTASPLSPELRDCYIEIAKCDFCPEVWGCSLFEGHTLSVVHRLKLLATSGGTATATPTGQTTSMTQGRYSQTWASTGTTGTDSWWSMTPEGAQFLVLRDSLGSVAFSLEMGQACSPWH